MTTQDWMPENLHYHITPNIRLFSSLDFNPLDYYVWGVVERETIKHPHYILDSLRATITRVRTHMDGDHANMIRACKHFRLRIGPAIAPDGDFIK